MSATIIDGKAVAARVRAEVAGDVAELREETGIAPGLATILVGDDPASAVYVANKRKACAEAGIADHHQHLGGGVSQDEVAAVIEECNANPEVSGILLQLPVPAGLDGGALTGLIAREGRRRAHAVSAGRLAQGTPGLRPCTPLGRDRAARLLRGRARGRRGGRRRPLRPGRQAGRASCCSSATPP